MSKQFKGTINLDIRDSQEDWNPYAEPKAKDCLNLPNHVISDPDAKPPNILYIVIDDTGFGAWEMFGGKIKMPNLTKIAQKGLAYTNFHTTALCSPTRSSLLNGRNANSNGMSCIEEATTGFPGSNGRIPFENALISEVLAERGYCTSAIGKWHLLPEEEANMAASKRNWPVGRGFERYYGFLGGETDQWYPDLVYDNHIIEPPEEPNMERPEGYEENASIDENYTPQGYHLSKDLIDKTISFIQDIKAIAPTKPWMLYFSPGANHAPHQIWPEMILKYGYNNKLDYIAHPTDENVPGGQSHPDSFEYYDPGSPEEQYFRTGYDEYREQVLARMQELGIFDVNIEAAPRNPHGEGVMNDDEDFYFNGKPWPHTEFVRPWDALTPKQRALFVRMAEIYASFSTYTDEQIGRLLKYLEDTDQMKDTIIVAVADNGASAEGGPDGSVNENLFFNDIPDDFETNFNLLQDLGTLKTYNHYPTGWAWGFDAPFKYWKRWSSYEGGDTTPFMICGPGITTIDETKVEYRKQYVHAIDLVPTLYECIGLEAPDEVNGYTQNPIEGISFAYTFAAEYAQPEYQFPYKADYDSLSLEKPQRVKETQFYAMLGTRGIWHRGWHANTVHPPTPSNWGDFYKDQWELYCMDGDTLPDTGLMLPADPIQFNNLVDPTYLDSLNPDQADELNSVLERMKSKWFAEAGRYNGMPLDDRSTSEVLGTPRPQLSEPPADGEYIYPYYPGCSEIPEAVAPNIRGRSYSITAIVDFSGASDVTSINGVLFSHGGRFGGHSLYMKNGQLCYVYNWLGQKEQKIALPIDNIDDWQEVELKFRFAKQGDLLAADSMYGSSAVGNVELSIGDGSSMFPPSATQPSETFNDYPEQFLTQPGKFSLCGEGMNISRDNGQPVSNDYTTPYEFDGNGALLKRVEVWVNLDDVEADELERSKAMKGMLWRD